MTLTAPQPFVRKQRQAALHSASDGEHRHDLGSELRSHLYDPRPYVPYNLENPRAAYNREVGRSVQQVHGSRLSASDPDTWTLYWMATIFGVHDGLRAACREQLLDRISLGEIEAPERYLLELPDMNDF